jgi:glyoxylase-like metal-dependent hydrolase (beta-lactamase superfamily II)
MEDNIVDQIKHQPIKLTPHLFQLGTSSFPVYLSMGEDMMIIEGGTGPTFDIIVSQIKALGIDPLRIKYIALTHTHGDHVGAVPRLRKIWPHIKVLAGATAEKFLKKDRFVKEFLPSDKMIGNILMKNGDIEQLPEDLEEYRFEADSIVDENTRIDLGNGIKWSVFETPGHSPCHISYFEEKEGTVTIGDMTGYFDPTKHIFWPNYFFSLESYCHSIKKMLSLPAKRGILSHNGQINGYIKEYFQKALKATEIYHREILDKIDKGETEEMISAEKADWICSIGALATYDVLIFLCKLLINSSKKDRGKDLFIAY